MKRKLHFTLVTIASLIYGQTVNSQIITYNFNSLTAPTTIITGFTPKDGTQEVVTGSSLGLTDNTTNVMHPKLPSSNYNTVADLDNFPTTAADYSVSWKEYITAGSTQMKKGFLLRGTGTSGYQVGIKLGYLFLVQTESSGTEISFRILKSDGTSSLTGFVNNKYTVSGFALNAPMWYRASAIGSTLKLEYSTDGITFTVGATFTDTTYATAGATQLVTGIGINSLDYYYDDITYRAGASLGIPSVSLDEKSIVVFKKDNTININSTAMAIKSVQLLDLNGRVIATKNNVNALETSFANLTFGRGIILVKITGTNNKVVTRKLVN